jgi:hypothetical protein
MVSSRIFMALAPPGEGQRNARGTANRTQGFADRILHLSVTNFPADPPDTTATVAFVFTEMPRVFKSSVAAAQFASAHSRRLPREAALNAIVFPHRLDL